MDRGWTTRHWLAAGTGILLALTLAACGGNLGTESNSSDTYPSVPVTLLIGQDPGGSTDLIGRALADKTSDALDVPVTVQNRPGANGALAAKQLGSAKPDGQTIMVFVGSLAYITPLAVSADEAVNITDYAVVTGISQDDYVLVASPKTGFRTVKDIVAAGRPVKYGSTGVGTGSQLAQELLFAQAKVRGTAVPFDGGNPTLTAVLGGQVDVAAIQVLPGLGPAATIAILLPLTFSFEPVTAIIMLAGIFYGAQYGGTITSVLLRLPGEASSVVTVFDGHAMARQGRAGTALGIAAIGSFVGGTLSVVVLSVVAPVVASFALDFGPPEYTALALLGILLVATISQGGRLKAIIAACLGLLLATLGRDVFTGSERFTFDSLSLADGIDFVPIAMGLFGLGEILYNLEERRVVHRPATVTNVWPSRADLRESRGAIGRGSILGFFLGVLPGGGATLASLAAYAVEKKRSKRPERFGRGAVEGVAAPETANNAAATSSFIPLLTLGIPANATMAVMFGALLIHGVTPGPQLVSEDPRLFWGVINSMYIGNVLLLIMSIPLVGLFVRILRVRPSILAPITVLITLIGVYTIDNSIFDIGLVIVFGALGYVMKKTGFDPGALVLASVLGSLLEASLRRSLLLFDGDPTGFLTRPISGTLLACFLIVALLPAAQTLMRRRRTSAQPPATDTEELV